MKQFLVVPTIPTRIQAVDGGGPSYMVPASGPIVVEADSAPEAAEKVGVGEYGVLELPIVKVTAKADQPAVDPPAPVPAGAAPPLV